jgi:hypothetical protein
MVSRRLFVAAGTIVLVAPFSVGAQQAKTSRSSS